MSVSEREISKNAAISLVASFGTSIIELFTIDVGGIIIISFEIDCIAEEEIISAFASTMDVICL